MPARTRYTARPRHRRKPAELAWVAPWTSPWTPASGDFAWHFDVGANGESTLTCRLVEKELP